MTSPANPGAAAPAKESEVFLREMDGQLAGWDEPAGRLRNALAGDELTLFCQPIAALSSAPGTARFPMAEVLVRLREEEKAMLPPGEFLPVFEHYRLMPDLDRWVVRQVLRHLTRGSRIPRFSINISTQSLVDETFPGAVAQELHAAGLPGSSLLFEIDESDCLAKLDAAARFSAAVRSSGCGVIVDGFGRRSATFAPLRALRPDLLKVDGVIIRKLLTHPAAEAKLRAVLRVGEVMEFQVVAEMVEEQDILARLKALGVAYAQGFGIRQPHPIELIGR